MTMHQCKTCECVGEGMPCGGLRLRLDYGFNLANLITSTTGMNKKENFVDKLRESKINLWFQNIIY